MALVTCPECGRENVSDMAAACPYCGFPLRKHFEEIKLEKEETEKEQHAEKDPTDKKDHVREYPALILLEKHETDNKGKSSTQEAANNENDVHKRAQLVAESLDDDFKKHQARRAEILAQKKQNTNEQKKQETPVHKETKTNNNSAAHSSDAAGTGLCIFGLLIPIILVVWLFVSCSSSFSESRRKDQEQYRNTLESGQQKYYNGESMTQEEYNAVKDFNNWKDKQGEHAYDDWNKK